MDFTDGGRMLSHSLNTKQRIRNADPGASTTRLDKRQQQQQQQQQQRGAGEANGGDGDTNGGGKEQAATALR
jgi:hypothetical protein